MTLGPMSISFSRYVPKTSSSQPFSLCRCIQMMVLGFARFVGDTKEMEHLTSHDGSIFFFNIVFRVIILRLYKCHTPKIVPP